MEFPCITLRTKDRDGFLHGDGYGGVPDAELEALLQKGRELVLSLETELENRQSISHHPPKGIRESCEKLRESAGNIRILGRLNDRDAKLAKAAATIMTTAQTNRGSKVYQIFLLDILRQCGRALVLLCAASLGKQRVIALNEQCRTSLVHYIKSNMSSLNSPALDLLPTEYGIPHENTPQCDTLAERSRKRARSEDGQSSSNSLDTREDDVQIEAGHVTERDANQPVQPTSSFSGRVFQLTIEDARAITMSDQVRGGVWLTDPYKGKALPFITFSISEDLSTQYALQRPQAM